MDAVPSLSLCIVSHERHAEVCAAVASASGQSFAEILVCDNGSTPPLAPIAGARLLRSETNAGASAGRNLLAAAATGDVLVFLDDDAVLRPGAAETVRGVLARDPGVGGLALRIVRPDGEALASEQPYRRGARRPGGPAPCAYFITAGCAVRREAYLAVGGSEERMLYGTDDIELAFRLLQAGWRLRYEPAAVVEHRPSQRGRFRTDHRAGHHLHNRILLARTYLPLPVRAVHIAAWIALTAVEALSERGLRTWARELVRAARAPVERRPMGIRTLRQIHRIGGRVLY